MSSNFPYNVKSIKSKSFVETPNPSSIYGILKGQAILNAKIFTRNLESSLHRFHLTLHNDAIEKYSAINFQPTLLAGG